jgi:hypothetical protein
MHTGLLKRTVHSVQQCWSTKYCHRAGVWPQTRGVGSLHRAPPQHRLQKKGGRGQRSILVSNFCWCCRYCLCGGCKGAAGPGRAKTSPRGRRKTVFGQILGCSCCDEETSRSENETRLVAAGPPGWAAVVVAPLDPDKASAEEISRELAGQLPTRIVPDRSRGRCTCVLCCRKSCETYTCHCPGFEKRKNQSGKKDDF